MGTLQVALSNLHVLPGVSSKCKIAWDEMTLGAAVELSGKSHFSSLAVSPRVRSGSSGSDSI